MCFRYGLNLAFKGGDTKHYLTMKKLTYLILLLPIISFAQSNADNQTAIDSLKTNTAKKNNATFLWRLYTGLNNSKFNITNGDILPIVNGGTGTSSPALVAGTNISITGSWPNQTINQSGGSGISNSAANTELMMSDGANAVPSGIFMPNTGVVNKFIAGGSLFTSMPMSPSKSANLEAGFASNGNNIQVPLRVSYYTTSPGLST